MQDLPPTSFAPLRIGLDYRPALVNGEGIGRATRELVRALVRLEDVNTIPVRLGLFGWTLAPAKFGARELGLEQGAGSRVTARLHRLRIPSRMAKFILPKIGGANRIVGSGSSIFHHTQPARLPVIGALQTTMLWDCIYLDEAGEPGGPWVEQSTAMGMAKSARQAARDSDLVFAPTEFVRKDLIEKLDLAPDKVVRVGLGCDHISAPDMVNRQSRQDRQSRPPFVLTVCRVDPRKNHIGMLRAFERLVAEGQSHHWIVAGPMGWRAEQFAEALENSPAKHRVHWLKTVGEAELSELYATCDVFFFGSHAEGFGLPPLEAMQLGRPVVSSNATCLAEVLGDAFEAVEPTSSDSMFEGLRRVLSDPDRSEELRELGPIQAARHTWKAAAENHLAAWARLAKP